MSTYVLDNAAEQTGRRFASLVLEACHDPVASRLRDAPSPASLALMPPDRAAPVTVARPGSNSTAAKSFAFWTARGCVARAPLRAFGDEMGSVLLRQGPRAEMRPNRSKICAG
jgi:hypothetical protein